MIPLSGVQAYVTQSNLLFACAYKMLPQEQFKWKLEAIQKQHDFVVVI